ncbi:MAG: DUF1460 domain-containing protein [Myxococcales bacterium]|nr:DUF1460 domain-containing protein [Myxococcales bacterium]
MTFPQETSLPSKKSPIDFPHVLAFFVVWSLCLLSLVAQAKQPTDLQNNLRQERHLLRKCGPLCKGRLDKLSPRRLNKLLRWAQENLTFHQRLRLFSKMYMGARYKFGPLGEGPKGRYDRDPIYRRDRVDCVTYIETVMAYALAPNEKQAIAMLQKIRYKDGKIDFAFRNHFTAPQWLVENQRLGLVFSSTERFGAPHLRAYHQSIPRSSWKGSRWGQRIPLKMLPKTYTLRYVPLEEMEKVAHKLPWIGWMGEVFDLPDHPSTIAHVGFFVRDHKSRLFFRHANAGRRGVRQDLLLAYAKMRLRKRPKHYSSKRILGFIFATFPTTPPAL